MLENGPAETPPAWASIVIPAWNEAARIESTLIELNRFAESTHRGRIEIIVVDDGSTDATGNVVRRHVSSHLRLEVLDSHRGKGAASRAGIASSEGERVLLLDADLPIDLDEIATLLQALDHADVIAGTRLKLGGRFATPQPLLRRFGGRGFRLVSWLAGFRLVSDPQCGAKALRGASVRPIAAACGSAGFGFDMELLERSKQAGLRIAECPVTWRHVPGSSLRPTRDAIATLVELVRLRRRIRTDQPSQH